MPDETKKTNTIQKKTDNFLFRKLLPSIMMYEDVDAFDGSDGEIRSIEKDYNPWVVNKALSMHYDTVHLANAMNEAHQMPNIAQYLFLKGLVRKYKREYVPWPKKSKASDETVELLKAYYGYSTEKAVEVAAMFPEAELEKIRKKLDVGGKIS
jgi:hypothetical protein